MKFLTALILLTLSLQFAQASTALGITCDENNTATEKFCFHVGQAVTIRGANTPTHAIIAGIYPDDTASIDYEIRGRKYEETVPLSSLSRIITEKDGFRVGQAVTIHGANTHTHAIIAEIYPDDTASIDYEIRGQTYEVMVSLSFLSHIITEKDGFRVGQTVIRTNGSERIDVKIVAIYPDGTADVDHETCSGLKYEETVPLSSLSHKFGSK